VIVIEAVKMVLQLVRALGVVRHGNQGSNAQKKGPACATPWNLARPAGIEPTTPWFVVRFLRLDYF